MHYNWVITNQMLCFLWFDKCDMDSYNLNCSYHKNLHFLISYLINQSMKTDQLCIWGQSGKHIKTTCWSWRRASEWMRNGMQATPNDYQLLILCYNVGLYCRMSIFPLWWSVSLFDNGATHWDRLHQNCSCSIFYNLTA